MASGQRSFVDVSFRDLNLEALRTFENSYHIVEDPPSYRMPDFLGSHVEHKCLAKSTHQYNEGSEVVPQIARSPNPPVLELTIIC